MNTRFRVSDQPADAVGSGYLPPVVGVLKRQNHFRPHLRLTGAGIDLLFRAKEVTPLQEIAETLKMQVAELQNQTRKLQKQVDAEQEAAKAANDLAKTAQAEAVSARKNALFSKVASIVSLSIGFAALVVSVLSLLV